MSDQANALMQKLQADIAVIETDLVLPKQRLEFLCAAECCDGRIKDMEKVQYCVQSCQQETVRLQNMVNKQINAFTNGFQRCHAKCEESARMEAETKSLTAARKKFDQCLSKCVGEAEKQLPTFLDNLRASLQ